MGRTNPTFRDRLRGLREDWEAYRRALRRRDRPHFDRLFEHARAHADAAGAANPDAAVVALLVSVAVEQEARIAALAERVDALETRLADDERSVTDDQTTFDRWAE